jgi:nitrate reductase gamma subunit
MKMKGRTAMSDKKLMLILKSCISIGILLILLGIYLHNFSETIEAMGVKGIIISAMCIAFGMILSLPTKMYLTFLLVKRESEAQHK